MTAEKYPSAALIRILEKNYKKSKKFSTKKSYKFKIGQLVRLLHKNSKNVFRKNYERRLTANTFIIYFRRKVNYINI